MDQGISQIALLQNATGRDLTIARRIFMLEILWYERYLTQVQLIARVDALLGWEFFGKSAWVDTFYLYQG